MHVHVTCPDGEAKFWLEPEVALAYNQKLPSKRIREMEALVRKNENEIKKAWKKHFKG